MASAQPNSERVFEHAGMRLTIAIDENGKVSRWTLEKEWNQQDTVDGLWIGN